MPRFATAAASPKASSEDRALVIPTDLGAIVCIADGTGGASGGGRAAELFVEGIRHATLHTRLDTTDPAAWIALLHELDHHIAADPHAGETTGIAFAIASGALIGASCGDSRAYLATPTSFHELTRDQHRKPRLGTGRAIAQSFMTAAHGILVVATDGLFDHAKLADIQRTALHPSADPAAALVHLVIDHHRTPPDDITVIVGWLD